MTVHECVAGIVGDKINGNRIQRHDVDNILHQSAERLTSDSSDFECMTVQMHRMLISAAIAEDQPVALTLLHSQWLDIRPGFVVDGPRIKCGAALCAIVAK